MATKAIFDLAEQLHWTSIRLLRKARVPDSKSGLSQAKLSALSVLVLEGECTMGQLASVERVKPQTMTGIVKGLLEAGYIERRPSTKDRRVTHLKATPKAKQLIARARRARMESIIDALGPLDHEAVKLLADATALLTERLSRGADTPYADAGRLSKRTRDQS